MGQREEHSPAHSLLSQKSINLEHLISMCEVFGFDTRSGDRGGF